MQDFKTNNFAKSKQLIKLFDWGIKKIRNYTNLEHASEESVIFFPENIIICNLLVRKLKTFKKSIVVLSSLFMT